MKKLKDGTVIVYALCFYFALAVVLRLGWGIRL